MKVYFICNFFYMTNVFTLLSIMQIFAFEVIPELGNTKCGTRRLIELPHPPRILKWELNKQPRGEKLDTIFTERVNIFFVH